VNSLNSQFAGFQSGTRYSGALMLRKFWQRTHTNKTPFLRWELVVSSALLDGLSINALSHDTAQLEVRKFLATNLNGFASLGIPS